MSRTSRIDRRRLLAGLALGGAAALGGLPSAAAQPRPFDRPIPASGERVPAMGLGSWITFNVGEDPAGRAQAAAVIAAFLEGGGRMIDSSPMYGSSQPVIGHALAGLGNPPVFAADKVWTGDVEDGPEQIEASRRYWGVERFDLLQVHNLLAWEGHLETLEAMKAAGRLRHVGITTSHGRRHGDMERIMAARPLDFVQLTYNPVDREAEARLLPLAAERGIAVIVNRPFRQGALTEKLAGRPLPGFAAEIGCRSWAQLILKFILSHPAVTCPIPATTRVDHVRENLEAAGGPLPDAALRERIAQAVRDA